ncbi:MAG: nuclear transport factor 2 family protein, partial [Saprospiraceae bacterium]
MKLTKKLEAEILKVYHEYWNSYLKGDVKKMATLIGDKYTQVGSAESEVFFNKKDAVKFLHDTILQVAGKLEMRNRKVKTEISESAVLINELCDIYALSGTEWIFYAKFRASTLMMEKKGEWKIMHQHSSFPDTRTEEGANIAIDKIAEENLQLREAVKRRTIELEEKNRELEIETALERVRAVAMAMHKQEDLTAIGKTIFTELKALGFSGIRNTEMVINKDEKETVKSFHYSDYGKQEIIEIGYKENPIVKKWAKDLKKAKNAFVPVSIPQKEMKSWNKYRKELGYKTDPKMARAKTVHYYSYSIGLGALSISCWQKLDDEQIEILERFRNVFNLAYQRYTDIAKAEAQAREAQIEASLERVRSRSLAMHHTAELQEVIHTVHKELLHLNIAIHGGSFIAINSDIETTLRCWGSGGTADTTEEVHIPLYKKPFCTNLINRIKKGQEFFTEAFTQKEKKDFFTFLFKYEPWSKLSAKQKKETLSSLGGYTRSCCVSQHTSIFIINHFGEKFSAADNDILQRFGKVFEQSYTRFLDLQKAEAQAREAEIELSLERVRARSLAMKSSDEMLEASDVMFTELERLSINALRIGICTIDAKTGSAEVWSRSENKEQKKDKILGIVPKGTHPVFDNMVKAWKAKKPFYINTRKGAAVKEYYTKVSKYLSYPLPEKYNKLETITTFFFQEGSLNVVSLQPLNANENEIMIRFANVFGQIYQRFLDLQKAETQAREAEIELALERVRARTMAMQHSDELQDAAILMFQQTENLGIKIMGCGFNIWDTDHKAATAWMTGLNHFQPPFKTLSSKDVFKSIYEAAKRGDAIFVKEQKGAALKAHYKYMASIPEFKKILDSLNEKGLAAPTFQIMHCTFFSQGYLMFITLEPAPEAHEIFNRFTKVFEQTYTRFLDLQKAEAQARDAEIELALERVRARTMAMKHSDELREVVVSIYEQLQLLNFDSNACNIIIYDRKTGDSLYWVSGFSQELYPLSYKIPFINHPYYKSQVDDWKKGKSFAVIKYSGKTKKEFDKIWFSKTDFKNVPAKPKAFMMGLENVTLSTAYFKYGAIQALGPDSLSDENANILQRLSKVFEQSYTRFLDLQKAEAQAREAQIELGLERVRARAMAMQHPDDLHKVNKEILIQLNLLQIQGLSGVTFYLIDELGWVRAWDFSSPGNIGDQSSFTLEFDFNKYEMLGFPFKTLLQTDLDYFVADYPLEKLKRAVSEIEEINPAIAKIVKEALSTGILTHQWTACSRISNGLLGIDLVKPPNEDTKTIVLKMAGAFNQAYIRFLDLQKAEAQAREAEIELALERIRARTMAMQHSDELQEASFLLEEQVRALGIKTWGCAFNIYREKDSIEWFGNEKGVLPTYTIPRKGIFKKYYDYGQKGNSILVQEIAGKKCIDHYEYMSTLPVIVDVLRQLKKTNGSFPDYQIDHVVYFKYGYLLFITVEQVPEAHDIFKRFAKVFEQTYTRFLDLQKAEAQAREAEIQLALERVRAKSLAMHNTFELQEVVNIAAQQLHNINIDINGGVFITINDEVVEDLSLWASQGAADYVQKVVVPFLNKPFFIQLREAIKKRNNFYIEQSSREEKIQLFKHLFKHAPWNDLPPGRKKELLSREGGLSRSVAVSQHTSIAITNHNGKNFSDNDNEILKRFGKVFEQTYTRFLDLQKAEAQAREAQVELSLERVRSRAMAMHKTDELLDAGELVYKELTGLGITSMAVSYAFVNEEEKNALYYGINPVDGKIPPIPFVFPHIQTEVMRSILSSWKKQDSFNVIELDEEATLKHQSWVGGHIQTTFAKNNIPFSVEEFLAVSPQTAVIYTFNFNQGYIFIIGEERLSAMQEELVLRFTKVFEMTYRRFLDLQKAEAQAREAQIELGLERVRARAMAMQNSEELKELIGTVFTELTKLDLVLTRCLIMIYDPKTNDSTWWMANSEAPSDPIGLVIQYHELPPYLAYIKAWKEKDLRWQYILEGAVKKDWDDFLFVETELSHLPDFVIAGMKAPDRVYLNASFNSFGNLTLASLEPLSDEHFDILLRFAKVFDLTYTRFNDLQKAEAQAREAQIETALERVRSRSMGMQKSEELKEVIKIVYQQLTLLKINLDHSGFVVDYIQGGDWHFWIADEQVIPSKITHPYFESVWANQFNVAKEKGADFFATHLNFEEKNKFYNELLSYVPGLPEASKDFYLSQPGLAASTVLFNNVSLYIENFSGIPYTDEENKILMRFGKVFEQTYTRFLDLQKSEAQAREAKIEAALERVRSRSMAMHQSNDLQDVAKVLSDQLMTLGVRFDTVTFAKVHSDGSWDLWISTPDQPYPAQIFVPYFDHAIFREINEASDQKQVFFEKNYTAEEKNPFFKYFFENTAAKNIPESRKQYVFNSKGFARSVFLLKNIWLGVANYEGILYSKEENAVLQRFAYVFEQSYTRFLDLQKAEASAKEAQIEAALEKVRSRSLAMHKSDELNEVVSILFEKIKELQIPATAVGIAINIEGSKDLNAYVCGQNENGLVITNYRLAYFKNKISEDIYNVLDKQLDFFVGHYSKKEKDAFYKYVLEHTAEFKDLPEDILQMIFESQSYTITMVAVKNAVFNINDFEGKVLAEKDVDIIKRFAKVFDQAYIRFIDLQKAEASAREAQIEAALEKVRSRSMGMQKSEELKEVIQVVYDEFVQLKINVEHTGFIIDYRTNDEMHIWLADRHKVPSEISIPYFDSPHWNSFVDAKENACLPDRQGKDFFANLLNFEEKNKFYTDLFELFPGLPEEIKEYYLGCKALAISTVLIDNVGLYIENFNGTVYTDEENKILMRFGKVFQQTYTRFLDLQKAEAQARESQIQLALERARTQSMVMQHSNELDDTLRVFHEQVLLLGIKSAFSFLWLPDEENDKHIFWAIWEEKNKNTIVFKNKAINYPLNRNEPATKQCLSDWKGKDPVVSYAVKPEGVENYFAAWSELLDGVEKLKPEFFRDGLYYVEAFMRYGCFGVMLENDLSEDGKNILYRFSIEFERAYTRFLDLQKAEAQAREATIEVSLERVRNRSMAMHKSDELPEISELLFQQVKELGVTFIQNSIGIVNEKTGFVELSTTIHGSHELHTLIVPMDDPHVMAKAVTAWREKSKLLTLHFEGHELKDYNALRNSFLKTKVNFPEDHWIVNIIFFTKGWLSFSSDKNISDEIIIVLKRFAAVFQQTYTRFLDLQKAEAQAREAQIETSLERVRSKTMAMHNSQDVGNTITTLFEELVVLGLDKSARCGIVIMNDTNIVDIWAATKNDKEELISIIGSLDMTLHPLLEKIKESWSSKKQSFTYNLQGAELINYYKALNDYPDYPIQVDIKSLPKKIVHNSFSFTEGIIFSFTPNPISDEFVIVFKKFASVFGQTYKRYLDLQKAEAQAREAQIETALEKVRSKTMSMHNSKDVGDTVSTMFAEFVNLGIYTNRCGILIFNNKDTAEVWTARSNPEGKATLIIGRLDLNSHNLLSSVYEAWKAKETFYQYDLLDDDLKRYYESINKSEYYQIKFDIESLPSKEFHSDFFFPEGAVFSFTGEPVIEYHSKIIKRFAGVFGQTYRRYLDLQKAEAQAREATIEASLERVRGKAMAMHSSEDLAATIGVFYHELET